MRVAEATSEYSGIQTPDIESRNNILHLRYDFLVSTVLFSACCVCVDDKTNIQVMTVPCTTLKFRIVYMYA